ncbi:MAG: hypothetical protein Q8Q08_09510 [Candidatus Omnitrophota bacterium]|nr:hypothetical protein [Candidatus Omnitrophota bacterium]MDZ4242600.1 hypothetical protein [Candidatus Omnitrophota bacterium]
MEQNNLPPVLKNPWLSAVAALCAVIYVVLGYAALCYTIGNRDDGSLTGTLAVYYLFTAAAGCGIWYLTRRVDPPEMQRLYRWAAAAVLFAPVYESLEDVCPAGYGLFVTAIWQEWGVFMTFLLQTVLVSAALFLGHDTFVRNRPGVLPLPRMNIPVSRLFPQSSVNFRFILLLLSPFLILFFSLFVLRAGEDRQEIQYRRPRVSPSSQPTYTPYTPPARVQSQSSFLGSCTRASDAALELTFQEVGGDYAGLWNNFGPGPGNANTNPEDFGWDAELTLEQEKAIKSMTMLHHISGEGWSTSSGQEALGKQLYPLVIFYEKQQLNVTYDQSLGSYPAGTHRFRLYAQKETATFAGSQLSIQFTDGTCVRAEVARVTPKTQEYWGQ